MNSFVLPPNAKVYRIAFDSLEACAQRARFGTTDMPEGCRTSRSTYDESWYLTKDIDEAFSWATDGWPEATLLFNKYKHLVPHGLLDKLLPAEEIGSKWEHAVSGGFIDMSVAAQDIGPLHFITEVEDDNEIRRGKNVQRIFVNAMQSHQTCTEAIMTRGILAFAVVDHLETLGYSIELNVESTIKGCSSDLFLTIVTKLKGFGESNNINRCLFALAHPSYLRRLIFGVQETISRDLRKKFYIGQSYGSISGVATRQKPNTMVLDILPQNAENTIKVFSDEIKRHYLNQDVVFEDEKPTFDAIYGKEKDVLQ